MSDEDLYTEFTLNGRRYQTQMYPVEYACEMEAKLGVLLGGGLGRVAGAFGETLAEVDGEQLGDGLESVFQKILDLGGPQFYRDVLRHTRIVAADSSGEQSWQKINLNEHFRGRLLELKQAVWKALRYNFESYFTDASVSKAMEALKARAVRDFQASPDAESTGS